MIKNLLFITALCFSIGGIQGCSESEVRFQANKLFSVSNFDQTMNEKKAVSISFGETESNYCSITLYRKSIELGYFVESNQKSSKDISADCQWGGSYYVQSSEHLTSAKTKITSLNSNSESAQLSIVLKLVNPKSKKFITVVANSLIISGSNFSNLTKQM